MQQAHRGYMKKIFISVVVTAYNRKEFLLEALKSAVNQTLQRDKYEIICIKNFKDTKIDNYIENNNIISIIEKEKTVGEYLYLSAKKAKGNILVFLDDDDLFSKDKLERVALYFSRYPIGFYHNLQLKGVPPKIGFLGFKENNFKVIKYPYKHNFKYIGPAIANMSSIAIKKNILLSYSRELKNIITNQDSFMFLISLMSKKDILIDNNKMTFYRIHDKNTSDGGGTEIEKYFKFYRELSLPALFYQLKLADKENAKVAKLALKSLVFVTLSDFCIRSNNKKDLIKAFKYISFNALDKTIIGRIGLSILFLLGSKYPYKRLTRNFKQ